MLNDKGFQRRTYSDLIDDMEDKAKELFGSDINTSARTPLGVILRIFAWSLSSVWEVSERVYNSGFVSKSEGVQLDRLGSNHGILREPAQESYVTLEFRGEPGHIVEEQTQFATESDVYFEILEAVTLNAEGFGIGEAISLRKGIRNNVGEYRVVVQAEPTEKLYSVTNPLAAAGASDRETDDEYKARIKLSVEGSSASTPPGIVAALKTVQGVRSANVVINNTMEVDEDGNPPKSIHAYVLGGPKLLIAEALFQSASAGIETVGDQRVTVTDLSGLDHVMSFDFAEEVKIFIKLELTSNAGFPTDGANQVKNNLVQLIGGEDSQGSLFTGSQMGEDVIISRMYNAIYKVPGVNDVTVLIGTSMDDLGQQNITIHPKQVAQTKFSEIEMSVVW